MVKCTISRLVLVVAGVLCVSACDPVKELGEGSWGDIQPPLLVAQTVDRSGVVELEFDEPVALASGSLASDSAEAPSLVPQDPQAAKTLTIQTARGSKPGKPYVLGASAKDTAGNTTRVLVPYYGANVRLPRVLINEIASVSSTTVRDAVELIVLSDGNLAGMTLNLGVPENNDAAFVFKELEVKAGEFLVVHCKAEGSASEKDEYGADLSESGGRNATASARDFWMTDSSGLPDAGAVISLSENPLGKLMDVVVYSDKFWTEGKDYGSFGTKKMYDRVAYAVHMKAWLCSGSMPKPEDAARSDDMTATRTLCRSAQSLDSDLATDWHVVPSGGQSLGRANSDAVFIRTTP